MAVTVDLEAAAKSRQWQEKRASKKEARAAKSPGKRRRDRKLVAKLNAITDVPSGTRRYIITIPRNRIDDAKKFGCRFHVATKLWFIDNPVRIADFAAWRPALVNLHQFVNREKAPLAEHAPSQRLDYEAPEKAQSAPQTPAEQAVGQRPADAASELRA